MLPALSEAERAEFINRTFSGDVVMLLPDLFGLTQGGSDCWGVLLLHDDKVIEVKKHLSVHKDAGSLLKFLLLQINNVAPKSGSGGAGAVVRTFQQSERGDTLQSSTQTIQLVFGEFTIEFETSQEKGKVMETLKLEDDRDLVEVWLVLRKGPTQR